MSVHHLSPPLTSPLSPDSYRGPLPAFPDTAYVQQRASSGHADHPPLPTHFPDPFLADLKEHVSQRSPPPMEESPRMVSWPAKQAVKTPKTPLPDPHKDAHRIANEAKEGLRRLTDKYAAPCVLRVSGSVCSSDSLSGSPPLSPVGTGPVSPSVSNNISSSPASPAFFPSPVMNGRDGVRSSTPRSNAHVQHVDTHNGQRLAPSSVSAFSDASSDFSDTSPSSAFTGSVQSGSGGGRGRMPGVGAGRYQSVSGISLTTSLGDGVTEEDVNQVEMFFRSHKTEVTVCRSLANLYFGSTPTAPTPSPSVPQSTNNGRLSPASGSDSWEFVTTGIPLLVLDSGDHVRARQLCVVVAEKGTGFVLWKDVISHLTSYSCPHANFHTLRISSDNHKLAGLSFDDSKAAAAFAATMLKLTSDPEDELLMLSKKGKKKKKKQETKKKQKFKPPKKTDISQPCCFQHVTKLERPQITGVTPLPPNGFPPAPGGSVSSLTDVFQERLTVDVMRGRSPSSELSDVSVDH